jgi:hypothetical protein
MLQCYPNRRLGATTLWAGARILYARRDRYAGDVLHDVIAGWLEDGAQSGDDLIASD